MSWIEGLKSLGHKPQMSIGRFRGRIENCPQGSSTIQVVEKSILYGGVRSGPPASNFRIGDGNVSARRFEPQDLVIVPNKAEHPVAGKTIFLREPLYLPHAQPDEAIIGAGYQYRSIRLRLDLPRLLSRDVQRKCPQRSVLKQHQVAIQRRHPYSAFRIGRQSVPGGHLRTRELFLNLEISNAYEFSGVGCALDPHVAIHIFGDTPDQSQRTVIGSMHRSELVLLVEK
jgi:hypothetical protein